MTGAPLPSPIESAALALRRGDPLTAMSLTDREASAIALAIRGAALAQLDEPAAAVKCLMAAATAALNQGDRDTAARAELALAEIHLSSRDFTEAAARLVACSVDLGADHANCAFVSVLRARLELYRGRPDEAARLLVAAGAPDAFGGAIVALARAEAELARGDVVRCEELLESARRHAQASRHGFLVAEIEAGRERLHGPAARVVDAIGARVVSVLELAGLRARADVSVIDELQSVVRVGGTDARLASRPLLFAIIRHLAASHPDPVDRDELVLALGVRKSNEAHRATLRVEIGRLREVVPPGVDVVAAATGWRIDLPSPLVHIAPLDGQRRSGVTALLSDGQAWRADDIARALGMSPRSAQRHLAGLRDDGVLRTVGAGRAARWILVEPRGFTLLGQLSALWTSGGSGPPSERADDRATDVARAT